MMQYQIITLFDELFNSFAATGLIQKAIQSKLMSIDLIDLRQFGIGKHCKVDDKPYGGGNGMLFRPEPVFDALQQHDPEHEAKRIIVTPDGVQYDQKLCKQLAKEERLLLFSPRYEGFDARIRKYFDVEISIGDFILMSGDLAALMIIESTARMQDGILGNELSNKNESFNTTLLKHDQYTKPVVFNHDEVPQTLLSGNHGAIEDWQKSNAIKKTKERRYDLYEQFITN